MKGKSPYTKDYKFKTYDIEQQRFISFWDFEHALYKSSKHRHSIQT
jgi:hypothetical protein